MAEKKVKITQIKSAIGYRRQAKDTLKALGIKKMNGDYYNVMGLPLNLIYRELLKLK